MITSPALRSATTALEWLSAAVAAGMGTAEQMAPVAASLFPDAKGYSLKYSPDQPREHGRFAGSSGDDQSGSGGHAIDATSAANSLKEPDGGFTYDPRTGGYATTGYAVSTNPERGTVIPDVAGLSNAELASKITGYAKANADIFSQPGTYIGGWHDPATGEGDLDVSRVVSTHEEAASLATAHNQIAYFDLAKGESVTVDRGATGSR